MKPKLSAEQKKTARSIVGKTIGGVRLQPFDPERYSASDAPATDPVIIFTDGSCLRFVVEETEVGEYGVTLVYPGRKP